MKNTKAAPRKEHHPYGTAKFTTIDEYHVSQPENVRKMLDGLRKTIRQAAPRAEEVISYSMPAFRLNGILVYYAASKNHIGFYPTSSPIVAFKDQLAKYKTSKGAIQFPLGEKIPAGLVKDIVKFRIAETKDKTKTKSKKPSGTNFVKYHNNGTVWARGKMVKNQPEGYWEWFRKDGVILRSGYFVKGKQAGEWTTYDKEGKVYKVTKMK